MDDKDAELRLREAALSASPILQPGFKYSKVTEAQLDKFRHTHTILKLTQHSLEIILLSHLPSTEVITETRVCSVQAFSQLDQELHKRRLHLIGKSKDKGRPKGKTSQVVKTCMVLNEDDGKIKVTTNDIEASKFSAANVKDNELGTLVMRKKKKLHWGLEAKERWERKANM